MKKTNISITSIVLSIVAFMLLISGCLSAESGAGKEKLKYIDNPGLYTYAGHPMAETEKGYYFISNGIIYYWDESMMNAAILGAKSFSEEEILSMDNSELSKNELMRFYLSSNYLFNYGENLYLLDSEYGEMTSQSFLIQINKDGEKAKKIADLPMNLARAALCQECIYILVPQYGEEGQLNNVSLKSYTLSGEQVNELFLPEFNGKFSIYDQDIDSLIIDQFFAYQDNIYIAIFYYLGEENYLNILWKINVDSQEKEALILCDSREQRDFQSSAFALDQENIYFLLYKNPNFQDRYFYQEAVSSVFKKGYLDITELPNENKQSFGYTLLSNGEKILQVPVNAAFLGGDQEGVQEFQNLELTIAELSNGSFREINKLDKSKINIDPPVHTFLMSKNKTLFMTDSLNTKLYRVEPDSLHRIIDHAE